ncbi:uncharacterized protein LOC113864389 isoform X2 [Abrus precatorius]|uniref:Uncharacterized protein LOC113864389 isoform X2 n=1 Tax=Abrus precatorius TaxID=3816 RepID=A0A8B8LEU9_ABRPR|nr:uncharacterized protein LOC113864389 isoform X2 [Abrus precatorius]
MEMDKSEEAMRGGSGFSTTKRHINKQQSQSPSSGGFNAIQFSEKSKKEKVRSLSAVAKALSSHQMRCRVSDSQKPNASAIAATKKFKLPRKFINDCNGVDHASVPRKIRSAMKKRSRESMLTDSEKVNRKVNGIESPEKDSIKKSRKRRSKDWSTREVLSGPITKDEEEVVETLYALAGMFPDNGSSSRTEQDGESLPVNSTVLPDQVENHSANATITIEASVSTTGAGERCEKISSLNETIGDEKTVFSGSEKFLVATHSSVPKINLQAVPIMVSSENVGKVALHDPELSLEMGLNVPTQSQISLIGRQSDVEFQTAGGSDCKQEQHIIKYQQEIEGPALWLGLSPRPFSGTSASVLQSSVAKAPEWLKTAFCASKQDLMESYSSDGKISEIVIHKKSRKRCAAHVHISHLIRSLEMPKGHVGKEPELYECHQSRVQQGSKCEVLMEPQNLNWMRTGNSSAAETAQSNNHETKNGILQQQGHYHDITQTPATPLVYGPHKQSFNFLSLSTGGNELKVNESFNKCESKLEPLSKSQVPYFQSLQQQHGLIPIQSQYTSTSFPDQLPVGPQVRLQQPHYYGTPLRGTHYSSTVPYKQQHQSFWAVQVAAQGGSAVNCSIGRAQYPSWQSGRHNSCTQLILPHSTGSLEAFGSKITSISGQQLFTLASSLTPPSRSRANGVDIHLPSLCEEGKGRFRSSGAPSLQLLCDERM